MSVIPQFPPDDIPIILKTFYKCGITLKKNSENEIENDITRKLVRRLRREPIFRDGHLFVDSNLELFRDDANIEDSAIDGILDFRIMSPHISHPEVYFVVEAKRLNVTFKGKKYSLASEYVTEGMIRFVSRKYAPEMKKHSMLGYVYDCDLHSAKHCVERAMRKFKEELLMDEVDFAPSDIISDTQVYLTTHREVGNHCNIYHLFLPISS